MKDGAKQQIAVQTALGAQVQEEQAASEIQSVRHSAGHMSWLLLEINQNKRKKLYLEGAQVEK